MASPAAVLSILVEANTGQATAALTKTEAQMKGLQATGTTSTSKLGTAFKTFAKTGALAAAAVGVAATKMALDYDTALEKVRNLVGESQKQVDEWGDALLKLAPKVGKSPQELADALYFVSSAGIKTSKVLNTVKISAQASAVGLGDTQTIADALTSAMNAYSKSGLSAADATNVMIKTVKFGKLEADQLAGSLGRVIPIASKLKVPFADVGGALATMSLSGLDAAEATTSLRGILSTILNPTSEAKSELHGIGIEVSDLQKMAAGPGGLLKVLYTLQENFKGNTEAMGHVFGNIRALTGVFNILGNQSDKVRKIFGDTEKNTNDLGKAMDNLRQTPSFKLHQALAFLQANLIRLGNVILDVAFNKVPKIVDSLEKFYEQSKVLQGAFKVLEGITKRTWAAIVEIVQGGAKILRGIVKVISGVLTGDFGRAWDGVKDIFKGAVQNELGILRAMTAPVRELAQRIGDALTGPFQNMKEAAVRIFAGMASGIAGVALSIIKVIRTVASVVRNVVRFIVGAVNKAVSALGDLQDKIPSISLPSLPDINLPFQRGGLIPGIGSGDKVPVMAEPGEGFINKKAVAAIGGPAAIDAINSSFPRFQSGGTIKPFQIAGRGPLAGMTRRAAEIMRGAANRLIGKKRDRAAPSGGLIGSVPTGPIQSMAKAMVDQIWGSGQWGAFNALEMSEAGWNPRALNASSGAAGLAQALPASKYPPGAWPYTGLESAKLQLQWMMGYIKDRYGTPSAAWAFHQANNWYAKGGTVGQRGFRRVGRMGRGIGRLDELIDIATRRAALPLSPGGEEMTEAEKKGILGLDQRLLSRLLRERRIARRVVGRLQRAPKSPAVRGRLQRAREVLVGLEGLTGHGGRIFDTKEAIAQLKAAPTSDQPRLEEMNKLLSEQLGISRLALAVSQGQYGALSGFAGGFAGGGRIPAGMWGVAGERGPEVVSGPANVSSGITVIVNGDIVGTPKGKDPVEVVLGDRRFPVAVEQVNRAQARRGRPLPGRAGSLG